ncbi:MAG: HAD family phosphatase [Atopobiaceae bacterium]|nr:HAD family phosphatase [Atopobiaceae bacterium]
MIKLVLTDLDNTLIPHKPGEDFRDAMLSDQAIAAIRALQDVGVHFGPVTGRAPASVAETFHYLPWTYSTGAYANGQLVCVDGDVVHREWTPAEPLQRVSDILDEQPDGFLVFFDMEGDGPNWGVSRKYQMSQIKQSDFLRVSKLLPEVEGPTLKAIIRLHGSENTPQLCEQLRQEVPELDFVLPSPDAKVIDIMPKGYGKGSAVLIMADYLGIGTNEVAVFGDADNDISALEAVPNSVAVSNASELAAAAARWHIADALEESVAQAMAEIAIATAQGEMPAFMCG